MRGRRDSRMRAITSSWVSPAESCSLSRSSSSRPAQRSARPTRASACSSAASLCSLRGARFARRVPKKVRGIWETVS
ncbi:hypothetical protein D3C85_680670 [compost metagenome]